MFTYQEVYKDPRLFNCTSSVLATLCREQGWGWERMFLDCWTFWLNPSDAPLLGGRVERDSESLYQDLLRYHGISVQKRQVHTPDELRRLLDRKTQLGERCAVLYDTYECPWVYNYQKEHQQHFSLVLGFEEDGVFLCRDTVPYSESTRLPLEQLMQNDFFLVTLERQSTCATWETESFLKAQGEKILAPSGPVEQLFRYAALLQASFDVATENIYAGTNSWACTPFLTDLELIARLRKSFAFSLSSVLEDIPGDQKLAHTAKQMDQIADQWYTVFLSSWKFFLTPGYQNQEARGFLSDAVRQMAGAEEALAMECIEMGR